MNPWLLLSLGIAALALAWWVPHFRLQRALSKPFPPAWRGVLENNIGVYGKLPGSLRAQLRRLVQQFLHQKRFSGAGGLLITDEIRVTIAAEACLLILNRSSGVYPGLRYVIVYPTGFVVDRARTDATGLVVKRARDVLGESWQRGKVILAWDSALHGGRDFTDGHNLVLHEFAHQLDSATGSADGAPLLGNAASYRTWATVLSREFQRLQGDRRRGRRSLMDHYGATNPAEFFAVATETFFEKPFAMARWHRELFDTLRDYYRIDPRDWSDPRDGAPQDVIPGT